MFEKVNPAHPDKVADRIAGAIVDLAYKLQENPKIAVEVLIGHGVCHTIIETTAPIDKGDIAPALQALDMHIFQIFASLEGILLHRQQALREIDIPEISTTQEHLLRD